MGQMGEIPDGFGDASEDQRVRRAKDGREVIGIGAYEDGEITSPFRGPGAGLSRRCGAGKMAAILGGYR
jgi:hypothetical protein